MSPKKVSESEKKAILDNFVNGTDIKDISKNFGFTANTITRQLKKIIGEKEFKKIKLNKINKLKDFDSLSNKGTFSSNQNEINISHDNISKISGSDKNNEFLQSSFVEIAPLNYEVDLDKQHDISSKPLSKVEFPKIVFMVVDKKNELEIKSLREFPTWHFLSENDLNRKTIEIYSEQKLGRKACSKNQKIIKVPNPNVFLITSQILQRKGISRIIFDQLLISL